MTGQGWKLSRDRVGIPTTLALGDQPEKAHIATVRGGTRANRAYRSKVRSRSTASGKRPAIVYCSHGVSEEHRKRQKGSGELDGSAYAVSPAHSCILR